METYKFSHLRGTAYECDKTGDNSGSYNKTEEVDRLKILLKAAHDILRACEEGPYVKNALSETAHYDETECDGYCLMEDIAIELGLEE